MTLQHILPEPCSPEYIDEVEAWVELKEVHSKEQVMEEFGDRIATPEEVTHLLNLDLALPVCACLFWLISLVASCFLVGRCGSRRVQRRLLLKLQ